MSKDIISDEKIGKQLRKIDKHITKDATKKIRDNQLNGVSFELYLTDIDKQYSLLESQLNNGFENSLTFLKQSRSEKLGDIEKLLSTLGNDVHRLQQAYDESVRLAEAAGIDSKSDLNKRESITIGPLQERFKKLMDISHRGEKNDN
jgi:hypothetical protein